MLKELLPVFFLVLAVSIGAYILFQYTGSPSTKKIIGNVVSGGKNPNIVNVPPPLNNGEGTGDGYEFNFKEKEVANLINKYSVSPYAGIVTFLDRSSSLTATEPENEYFVLKVNPNYLGGNIDISNWVVFSFTDKKAYVLPRGTEVFIPGKQNTRSKILLRASDVVIVNSGRSPIGTSFRLNKCSGYSQQFQTFKPSLKNRCPKATSVFDLSDVEFTDSDCYDFVKRIQSCKRPVDIPDDLSTSCKSFLKNSLNEKSCINDFSDDADFSLNEVRLFFGSSTIDLWKDRDDALFLLDAEERLVDVLEY